MAHRPLLEVVVVALMLWATISLAVVDAIKVAEYIAQ
jgi:hypothetical protein